MMLIISAIAAFRILLYESAAVGVDGVLSANLLDVTLAHGGVAVTGEQLTDRTLTGDLEIVTEDGETANVTF